MFEIGDWVKVRPDLKIGESKGRVMVLDAMEAMRGKTLQVQAMHDDCPMLGGYYFHPDMLCEEVYDQVNHPAHYTYSGIEAIEVIDAFFKDNYYLGQVFKYTARAGHKQNELEDLKKAKWYLDRYVESKEGEKDE